MLQHVTFEVARDRVPACVAFYELLGFRRVEPPPSLSGATWLERAGTQIHLLSRDEPVALPEGHAAVVVDDYDATLERLRAAGHDPDPRTEHWGSPRAFVRDPAGNRVELMAAPPSAAGAA